jgi:hypothetical protein
MRAFFDAWQAGDRTAMARILLDHTPDLDAHAPRARGRARGLRTDGASIQEVVSPWMGTKHAAAYANMSVNQFRKYLDHGLVRARRSASRLLFHVDDIDELMDRVDALGTGGVHASRPRALPAPRANLRVRRGA